MSAGRIRRARRGQRHHVVVATDASSGLWRATSLALATEGHDLVLAARGSEALEQVARQCRDLGARAAVAVTDVAEPGAVAELSDLAIREFGRVDVCISAAVGRPTQR